MRRFLLYFILLTFSVTLSAQITSGDKLTGNITGTDIKGNPFDIYADLAAGKTVIIDVFATWCGPCWSYHTSGYLKNIYKVLGPDGTDQVRIYSIEGDNSTAESLLYGKVAGSNAATTSLGDWTEGVEYTIVNSAAYNSLLKIAFFPTLYVIRPDKTVMEMGDYRTNDIVWTKALLNTAEKDIIFTSGITDKTFCSVAVFNQKPTVINMGTTPISVIDADLIINGVSTLTSLPKVIGVFQEAELGFATKTFNETTKVEVVIDAIDGQDDEADDYSSLEGNFIRPVVEEQTVTVKFTTDFYPGEISWRLIDNKNKLLKAVTYRAGNADADGGGGADANKEFSYDIVIPDAAANCLTLTITDSYGDGLSAFNSTLPTPGVEFYSSTGELLKPKMTGDWNFRSGAAGTAVTNKIFTAVSISSSLNDQDFVQNLNVYPNPVTDVLNIDMTIESGVEYEVFVSDIMGSVVTKVQKNTNFLQVSELGAGMYFLNVRTKDGVYAHKFTKI